MGKWGSHNWRGKERRVCLRLCKTRSCRIVITACLQQYCVREEKDINNTVEREREKVPRWVMKKNPEMNWGESEVAMLYALLLLPAIVSLDSLVCLSLLPTPNTTQHHITSLTNIHCPNHICFISHLWSICLLTLQ